MNYFTHAACDIVPMAVFSLAATPPFKVIPTEGPKK
jgi:hypothetical protein